MCCLLLPGGGRPQPRVDIKVRTSYIILALLSSKTTNVLAFVHNHLYKTWERLLEKSPQ